MFNKIFNMINTGFDYLINTKETTKELTKETTKELTKELTKETSPKETTKTSPKETTKTSPKEITCNYCSKVISKDFKYSYGNLYYCSIDCVNSDLDLNLD